MIDVETVFEKFGVGIGMLVVSIIFLVFLVRWILSNSAEREKRLTTIISNHQEHIAAALTQACLTMKQVQEASATSHQHQQLQHEKMISCLDRMKGKISGV